MGPFNFHQLINTKSHLLIIWGLYRMAAFALNSTYRMSGQRRVRGILFRYTMIYEGKYFKLQSAWFLRDQERFCWVGWDSLPAWGSAQAPIYFSPAKNVLFTCNFIYRSMLILYQVLTNLFILSYFYEGVWMMNDKKYKEIFVTTSCVPMIGKYKKKQ